MMSPTSSSVKDAFMAMPTPRLLLSTAPSDVVYVPVKSSIRVLVAVGTKLPGPRNRT